MAGWWVKQWVACLARKRIAMQCPRLGQACRQFKDLVSSLRSNNALTHHLREKAFDSDLFGEFVRMGGQGAGGPRLLLTLLFVLAVTLTLGYAKRSSRISTSDAEPEVGVALPRTFLFLGL